MHAVISLLLQSCTELFFVEPGTKIKGAYYRDLLFATETAASDRLRRVSGNDFVFAQDSASAHRARATVELLSCVKKRQLSCAQLV